MTKMESTNSSDVQARSAEQERLIQNAEFAWDLAIQLAQLRRQQGLSQADLARLVDTKQQAISRLESPEYDRHSLQLLRRVAAALDAHVDVVLVPRKKADAYKSHRYQPVLDADIPATPDDVKLSEADRSEREDEKRAGTHSHAKLSGRLHSPVVTGRVRNASGRRRGTARKRAASKGLGTEDSSQAGRSSSDIDER